MVKEHPEAYSPKADFRIDAVRLRDQITSRARTVLLVLLAASVLVFVIACSNVANLILARTVRREGELAIRAALGASTGALRRTLLAESLLLCGAGAALGVLSARPMVAILARYASRFSVRALDLTVDSSMLWVAALLAVVAAVLLAFVPRLPSADSSHGFGLASGSLRITRQHGAAAAGLRRHADRRIVRAAGRREHAAQDAARAAGGADRLRHAPGARDQCAGDVVREDARADRGLLPGDDPADHGAAGRGSRRCRHGGSVARRGQLRSRVRVLGGRPRPRRRAKKIRAARFRTVSPGFFAALGVPIIAGRDFNDADRRGGEPVVIVSQSLAQRMFPNQDAVNRHMMWTDPVMKFIDISPAPRRIVGVAADIDDENVVPGPAMTVYHPFGQEQLWGGRLFVHARGNPYALVSPITRIIRDMSADQPVERAATLEDVRAEVLTPDRLNALVFGGFAAVALAIAVVGVAGVLAFSVSGRTREFGIRLAIGSQPRHLLTGVIARGRRHRGGGRRCRRGVRVRAGAAGRQLFPGYADAGRRAGGRHRRSCCWPPRWSRRCCRRRAPRASMSCRRCDRTELSNRLRRNFVAWVLYSRSASPLLPKCAKSRGGDVFGSDAKISENVGARRGSAEVRDADDHPFVTSPAMPADRRRGLHRDALLDALGQDAFTVSLVLGLEQIPARHADDACLHSVALQPVLCLHAELNFGAATDEDDIGPAIAGFGKNIGASRYARALRFAAIEMSNILAREHQHRWTIPLDCQCPSFGSLVRIGRANHAQAGNARAIRRGARWAGGLGHLLPGRCCRA